MSILVNKQTRVLVHGITGTQASFHVKRMLAYGTNIVAGVSPYQPDTQYLGVPIFENATQAVLKTQANASLLFVPAQSVKAAVKDALNAGIKLIVSIAYGVPIFDVMEIHQMVKAHHAILIGPNTPGIITPNETCLGVLPTGIHQKGEVGIVSRSSTLTYEAVLQTNLAGFGESTVLGVGDDMIAGCGLDTVIKLFEHDEQTKAIVVIGALGGTYEEEAAAYYQSLKTKKPLIAYITGHENADADIGYASDILTHGKTTIREKKNLFKKAGAVVIDHIDDLSRALSEILK